MHTVLIEKLKELYDDTCISKILSGLTSDKKVTFRVNVLKCTDDFVLKSLIDEGFVIEKINDFMNSYAVSSYNSEKKTNAEIVRIIENLDVFKNGFIYLQSLSSMMPVYVLNPKSSEDILDMCAAPGSKTTLIQAIAQNKVNLTAVELNKKRFERLKYNVNLQGAKAYLLNINSCDLDDNLKFDKILLDAPCSGSGVIDIKDENYTKFFTEELIETSTKRQKKLLSKAKKLLKKGGVLVYSTCSLLKEENEDMVKYAISLNLKLEENSLKKVLPDELYEGFFMAKFVNE